MTLGLCHRFYQLSMPKVNEKFYSGYSKLLGEVFVNIFGHGLSENVYHSEERGPSKRKVRNKRRQ